MLSKNTGQLKLKANQSYPFISVFFYVLNGFKRYTLIGVFILIDFIKFDWSAYGYTYGFGWCFVRWEVRDYQAYRIWRVSEHWHPASMLAPWTLKIPEPRERRPSWSNISSFLRTPSSSASCNNIKINMLKIMSASHNSLNKGLHHKINIIYLVSSKIFAIVI